MASPSKNTIIISGIVVPVLAALLTALLTDVGKKFTTKLFPPKVYVEGVVLAEGKPISDLTVFLDNELQSYVTDNRGKFIFIDVPTGSHNCNFTYGGKPYRYSLLVREGVDQTITEQFDIGAKVIATPTKTSEEKLESKQPEKKSESAEAGTNEIFDAAVEPDHSEIEVTQEAVVVSSQMVTEHRTPLTADKLLEKLEMHVRVNKQDVNRSGKQFAFNYYLDGKDEYLDQIKAVFYIRNHKSFSEYANNRYLTVYDRASNFNYKAYQWGYIQSVYVNVQLKNGNQSEWAFKEIIYD